MISDNKVRSLMKEAELHFGNGMDMWHNNYGKSNLVEFKKSMEFILKEVEERIVQEEVIFKQK